MRQSTKYYTKMIVDLTDVESYEADVREFQVEAYIGTTDPSFEAFTYFESYTVAAAKKNDFVFQPVDIIRIDRVEIGVYYYFRIRIIKNNGEASRWSQFHSEKAGDNENLLSFDTNPVIINNTDSIKIVQALSDVPIDIDRYDIAVVTNDMSDVYDTTAPASPGAPLEDVKPDISVLYNPMDYVLFTWDLVEELKWYYFYIRAVDYSGNIASNSGANDWHYIGVGRSKAPVQSDGMLDSSFEENIVIGPDTLLRYWIYDLGATDTHAPFGETLAETNAPFGIIPMPDGQQAVRMVPNEDIVNKYYFEFDNGKPYYVSFNMMSLGSGLDSLTYGIYIDEYNSNGVLETSNPLKTGTMVDFNSGLGIDEWHAFHINISDTSIQWEQDSRYLRIRMTSEVSNLYIDNIIFAEIIPVNIKAGDNIIINTSTPGETTISAIIPSAEDTTVLTAGETILINEVVFIDTDGKVRKAIADDVDKSTVKLYFAIEEVTINTTGNFSDNTTLTMSGLSIGKPYYLSADTAGAITLTNPVTTPGQVGRVVGSALDNTTDFKAAISPHWTLISI